MKKYALPLLLIFSLTINIAATCTLLFHYWRGKRQGSYLTCNRQPFGRFLKDSLQLEGKDLSCLQSFFYQDKEELFRLKKQVHTQRQVLFDLLAQKEIDSEKIDRQIEKISGLQAQMEKMIIKRIIAIKSNLPEGKQKRLLESIQQRIDGAPRQRPFTNHGQPKKRGW